MTHFATYMNGCWQQEHVNKFLVANNLVFQHEQRFKQRYTREIANRKEVYTLLIVIVVMNMKPTGLSPGSYPVEYHSHLTALQR